VAVAATAETEAEEEAEEEEEEDDDEDEEEDGGIAPAAAAAESVVADVEVWSSGGGGSADAVDDGVAAAEAGVDGSSGLAPASPTACRNRSNSVAMMVLLRLPTSFGHFAPRCLSLILIARFRALLAFKIEKKKTHPRPSSPCCKMTTVAEEGNRRRGDMTASETEQCILGKAYPLPCSCPGKIGHH